MSRGGDGGTALRLRLGGDRRREAVLRTVFRVERSVEGMGGGVCDGVGGARLYRWRNRPRLAAGPVRTQTVVDLRCDLFHCERALDSVRHGLLVVHRRAHPGRCRDWTRLERFAGLYRRGLAAGDARAARLAQPNDHRAGHYLRAAGELPCFPHGDERRLVARHVRRGDCAGGALPCAGVFHPGESEVESSR